MANYRPVRINKKSLSVKLTFYRMGFDAAQEWVKAYRHLDTAEARIKALEAAMPYLYPKLAPKTQEQMEEIEQTLDMEEDLTTQNDSFLLEALESNGTDTEAKTDTTGAVETRQPVMEKARGTEANPRKRGRPPKNRP